MMMVVVVKYGVVYMPEEALIDYDKHFLKYLQLTRTTTTIYILFSLSGHLYKN